MSGVVKCVAYAGGRPAGEVPIEDVSEVLEQGDRFVWIDLHEPDEPLLRQVQAEFGLHDLAIEDALRAHHERPKVEQYGDSLFVVLRTMQVDRGSDAVEYGETYVFAGPRYVVTGRHGASHSLAEVRARCESSPELLARGSGFVLYALIDFVVDRYFPVVEALEDALDAIEEQVFGPGFDRQTTESIYRLKRRLVDAKRTISPLLDVCNRLMRFDLPLITDDIRLYVRDVYDHVVRLNEMVDSARELLTTALEASLSLTTVSQNDAMKRLAGWGAIFAVPTMIAGVYGMNFHHMPELDWPLGYPVIMLVMLGVCGMLYWRFRRAGWL